MSVTHIGRAKWLQADFLSAYARVTANKLRLSLFASSLPCLILLFSKNKKTGKEVKMVIVCINKIVACYRSMFRTIYWT